MGRRQLRSDVFYVSHRGSIATPIPVMQHMPASEMLAFTARHGRLSVTVPEMAYTVGAKWNTSACDPGEVDELPMGFSRVAHGFFFVDAIGDFFLVSRRAVMRMRGHPEIPHLKNVDGLMPYTAAAHGLRQLIMRPQCSIYHQEHARSARSHVESFQYADAIVVATDLLAAGPLANHRPPAKSPAGINDSSYYEQLEYHRWNGEDWGLAAEAFDEIWLTAACRRAQFASEAFPEATRCGGNVTSELCNGERDDDVGMQDHRRERVTRSLKAGSVATDELLEHVAHPDHVLVGLRLKAGKSATRQSIHVVCSGLVAGALYRLQITIRKEGTPVLEESRQLVAPVGEPYSSVEVNLPTGTSGMHYVDLNLYDAAPRSGDAEILQNLLAKRSHLKILFLPLEKEGMAQGHDEESEESRLESPLVLEAQAHDYMGQTPDHPMAALQAARADWATSLAGRSGGNGAETCFKRAYLFQECHHANGVGLKRCAGASVLDHIAYCLMPPIGFRDQPVPFTDLLGTKYNAAWRQYEKLWGHPCVGAVDSPDHCRVILPCLPEPEGGDTYFTLAQTFFEVLRFQLDNVAASGDARRSRFTMCMTGMGSGRAFVWAQRSMDILSEVNQLPSVELVMCGAEPSLGNYADATSLLFANGLNFSAPPHDVRPGVAISAAAGFGELINTGLGASVVRVPSQKEGSIQFQTLSNLTRSFDVIDFWVVDLQGSNVFAVLDSSVSLLQGKFKTVYVSVSEGDHEAVESFFTVRLEWICGYGVKPNGPDELGRGAVGGVDMVDGCLVFHNPRFVSSPIPDTSGLHQSRTGTVEGPEAPNPPPAIHSAMEGALFATDKSLEPIQHPDHVLVGLQLKAGKSAARQSIHVVCSGLVAGALYRLQITIRKEGTPVLEESRQLEGLAGETHSSVEVNLPTGTSGMHYVDLNLYDSFPDVESDLLARLAKFYHVVAQPEYGPAQGGSPRIRHERLASEGAQHARGELSEESYHRGYAQALQEGLGRTHGRAPAPQDHGKVQENEGGVRSFMSAAGFTAATIEAVCRVGLTVADLRQMTVDDLKGFLDDLGATNAEMGFGSDGGREEPSRVTPRFWYVELGAHNGRDAKNFLEQNPHYTPILVEANPMYHAPLRRLCAQYNSGVYLNAAAWIRNEMLEFQIFPSDDHASSIFDVSPAYGEEMRYHASVVMVHAFDLARYLKETVAESDILRIRMDVQGAEYRLLRHLLVSGMACRIDTLIVEFHAMHATDTFQYVTLDGALPWILLACPSIKIATQNFYHYACELQDKAKVLDQLGKPDRPPEGFNCVEIVGTNGRCPSRDNMYAMVCSSWEIPTSWY